MKCEKMWQWFSEVVVKNFVLFTWSSSWCQSSNKYWMCLPKLLYELSEKWCNTIVSLVAFLFQISAEFQRITTVHLEPKFMSGLDLHTPKLLKLFHAKGGALGERLKIIMEPLEVQYISKLKVALLHKISRQHFFVQLKVGKSNKKFESTCLGNTLSWWW